MKFNFAIMNLFILKSWHIFGNLEEIFLLELKTILGLNKDKTIHFYKEVSFYCLSVKFS